MAQQRLLRQHENPPEDGRGKDEPNAEAIVFHHNDQFGNALVKKEPHAHNQGTEADPLQPAKGFFEENQSAQEHNYGRKLHHDLRRTRGDAAQPHQISQVVAAEAEDANHRQRQGGAADPKRGSKAIAKVDDRDQHGPREQEAVPSNRKGIQRLQQQLEYHGQGTPQQQRGKGKGQAE